MTNYLYEGDLPQNLNLGNIVAIDTETMGLNIGRDRLCLLQISSGDGNAHLVKFKQNEYNCPNLLKILKNEEIIKIFHYARFDIACINFYLKIDLKNVYCTKIASKLVRTYTDSHGLRSICDELLEVEISKKQQCSYWGADEISKSQIQYAANDVIYLHRLKAKLDQMLKKEGRTEIYNECINFLYTRVKLDLIGYNGDIFSH